MYLSEKFNKLYSPLHQSLLSLANYKALPSFMLSALLHLAAITLLIGIFANKAPKTDYNFTTYPVAVINGAEFESLKSDLSNKKK